MKPTIKQIAEALEHEDEFDGLRMIEVDGYIFCKTADYITSYSEVIEAIAELAPGLVWRTIDAF